MILGILQARLSSSRLPGKVLMPVMGKPLIGLQIEREKRIQKIDTLVVATSTDASDDALADFCHSIGVTVSRGSLNDVLDRFYQAAKPFSPDFVVRLTGDCPLVDPALADEIISFCVAGNYDYASNSIEPTYPDGLDIEVLKFSALEEAWKNAALPSQREHVTSYVNRQPDHFKIGHFRGARDLSHLRWTVDEPADFELITAIYEALYPQNPEFTTEDILTFLEKNPRWLNHNTGFKRNEGFAKSLEQDPKGPGSAK